MSSRYCNKCGHYSDDDDKDPVEGPRRDKEAETAPAPKTVACSKLSELLASTIKTKQSGEFSFGGPAPMLPGLPGLAVEGMGTVPLPLTKMVAQELVTHCERAPFGKDYDTILDDNVRNSWQLSMKPQDGKVSIRNPQFQDGLNKLMNEHIAPKLGFKDIPLRCEPYKLLVYEPGGHFLKHQDTEKEDGMIATLVIQLPSEHQGGDLVVYQGKTMPKEYRHDFGKADGTAPFGVHYAVHYADAVHALECVTSGYRLALVYSICLPPTLVQARRGMDEETEEATEAMATVLQQVASEGSQFTWFLKHEYTDKSISEAGASALKGLDRARFQALVDGNARISDPAARMAFFIAQLNYSIDLWDDGGSWEENERKEYVSRWYSLAGQVLGSERSYYGSSKDLFKPTENVLNPDQLTLSELWGSHGENTYEGYLGNEGATKSTRYQRFTIVGWPQSQNIALAQRIIGPSGALVAFTSGPITADSLREFMTSYSTSRHNLSAAFGKTIVGLIIQHANGDASMARLFLDILIDNIDKGKQQTIITSIKKLIDTFGWSETGSSVCSAMVRMSTNYASALNFPVALLKSVDATSDVDAFAGILATTVEIAVTISHSSLAVSPHMNSLWKLTIPSESDLRPFTLWCNYVKKADPTLLGDFIKGFEGFVIPPGQEDGTSEFEKSKTVQSELREIMKLRLNWLNIHRVAGSDSWAMPEAIYERDPRVQAFLRGPEESMTLRGFNDSRHASNYSRKHRHEQKNASFDMRAYLGAVTIKKTRNIFARSRPSGLSYEEEAQALSAACGEEFELSPPAPIPVVAAAPIPSPIATAPSAPPIPIRGRRQGQAILQPKKRLREEEVIVVESD